jgi:hypothetical protein
MSAKQDGDQPLELSPEQRFQAVLARFQDHVEQLRAITGLDLQVLGGFMTLQLALAAWLVDHVPKTPAAKWGLLSLSAILTALAVKLFYNSYHRRKEVVASLANTKTALGFLKKGIYLRDTALDAETTFRPWLPWYLVACFMTLAGVAVMIFFGGFEKAG